MVLEPNYNKDTFSGMLETEVNEESIRNVLLPELDMVKDAGLRDKVVKAWALACQMGGYEQIEEVPTMGFEWCDKPLIQHEKDTARIAAAIVDALSEIGVELNRDYVIAGSLCHDVGVPLEGRKNRQGYWTPLHSWVKKPTAFYAENPNMPMLEPGVSYPVTRHPVFSAYIAMTVGMPEHMIHIVATHSNEGDLVLRTPEAAIVHDADEIWWYQVGKPGYPPVPEWRLGEPVHWWKGRTRHS